MKLFSLYFFLSDCLVTFFKAAAPVCRTNALYKHLARPHFYLSQPVPGCSSTNYTRQSLNDLFYSHSLIYFSQTRLQRRSLTKLVFKFRNQNGSTHLACCSQPPIQMLDLSFLQKKKKTCALSYLPHAFATQGWISWGGTSCDITKGWFS